MFKTLQILNNCYTHVFFFLWDQWKSVRYLSEMLFKHILLTRLLLHSVQRINETSAKKNTTFCPGYCRGGFLNIDSAPEMTFLILVTRQVTTVTWVSAWCVIFRIPLHHHIAENVYFSACKGDFPGDSLD